MKSLLDIFTVTFIGHRYIDSFSFVEEKVEELIRELIATKEYVDFLIGRDGEFDQIVASTILRVKRNVFDANSTLERLGYPVAYLRPDHSGVIKPTELDRIIANTTGLVSVMLANNEIGTIQPIKELAQIAHEHGALFHTDAVQAVGHIEIDVKDLGVDFLSASAHKFNGPKGCGFLYIKKGTQINPLLDGGAQESEHRAGTENVASIVGMARALEDNCSCLHDNTERILEMEKALLSELTAAHVHFHRNGCEPRIPGNISLSLSGIEGEALLHRLDLRGICVSTGSACDSVNTQISHVLRAISLDEKLAKGTIRISLGKNNTAEEAGIIE